MENMRISRTDKCRSGTREWTTHRLRSCDEGSSLNEADYLRSRKLNSLPSSASKFYEQEETKPWGWNPVLRTILVGTHSEVTSETPLALLRAHGGTLVREIMSMVFNPVAEHVRLTIPAALCGNGYGNRMRFTHGRSKQNHNYSRHDFLDGGIRSKGQKDGFVAFSRCGRVEFPTPNGRNVNMLPFILGDQNSLPSNLQCYFDSIEACPFVSEEVGRVAYLTVQENYVDVGTNQRRGGLHIESPGFFHDDPDSPSFEPGVEHPWGMGVFFGADHYEGGIYFASSVGDTSEIWDALVDSSVPGVVEPGGGCEHLRALIGEGTKLRAGELVWMTDRTPHEALPQTTSGLRQFFRLVMPGVSHWYADHSTSNPRVDLPEHVTIIRGNKFDSRGVATVSEAVTPNYSLEDFSSEIAGKAAKPADVPEAKSVGRVPKSKCEGRAKGDTGGKAIKSGKGNTGKGGKSEKTEGGGGKGRKGWKDRIMRRR